ncbi:SPTBN5 [Cordylochernes scorpioides]|uniref:SPTBN5 n=1 Tax=Cordylochernes scorpioides TaxID=51811 RepID=A0ABY6JWX9_9ARAC|nr:SPTBN5 [Cordylochernes scorpioides]
MEEEWSEEMVTVPVEEWVEVVVEKEVVKEFVEEKRVPQVQALYNFTGQGLEVKKGEVMILLQKTNSDWWNIRKATGQDGFVPANYVKTIESRIVRKPVKKTVKVPEKQRVKSIVMKRQIVRKKKEKSPAKKSRAASLRKDIDVVELRQKNINNEYETLKHLARVRHQKLEEAKKLFSFYTECEDFENWMKEKNFLTELSASRQRVEDIDTLVDNFNKSGSTKLDTIKSHQRQIHQSSYWIQTERHLEKPTVDLNSAVGRGAPR